MRTRVIRRILLLGVTSSRRLSWASTVEKNVRMEQGKIKYIIIYENVDLHVYECTRDFRLISRGVPGAQVSIQLCHWKPQKPTVSPVHHCTRGGER